MVKEKLKTASAEKLRPTPPAFVSGFRFGNMRNQTLVIDFMDGSDNEDSFQVFSSIALNKTTAQQMLAGIQEFLKHE